MLGCLRGCMLGRCASTLNIAVLLPARASEQGNVIGLVSVYISLITRVRVEYG